MLQPATDAQTASIEGMLKFTRDVNDLAAVLAELTAKVRLIRLQHAIRTATLVP